MRGLKGYQASWPLLYVAGPPEVYGAISKFAASKGRHGERISMGPLRTKATLMVLVHIVIESDELVEWHRGRRHAVSVSKRLVCHARLGVAE